jgi:hypothetical protein
MFEEVIPHLTVGQSSGDALLDTIEAYLIGQLPITARLTEACVYVFDGRHWQLRARLPFQGRLPESVAH